MMNYQEPILTQYQSQIDEFENELKKTRESIAETSNSLVKIKEKATRKQEINEKYKGTLTEIAENLERDAHYSNGTKMISAIPKMMCCFHA
jgi:uncharacterized coiled-coil DUF342 family protein